MTIQHPESATIDTAEIIQIDISFSEYTQNMQGFVDHINKREDQNPNSKITGKEYSRDHCHYNNQDHQTVCEIHIVLSKPFIPDKWFVFIMIDI